MYETRETLVAMFCARVRAQAHRPAIRLPAGEGTFRSLTWAEVAHDVRRAALALVRLGVKPGDRVVQVSENRYEWIVVDLAVHLARAVHVAVHAALSAPQIAYQILDSGARLAIVSGGEQMAKLDSPELGLQDSLSWLTFDPIEPSPGGKVVPTLVSLLDRLTADGDSINESTAEQAEDLEAVALRRRAPTIWRRFCTPPAQPASRKA